MSVWLGRSVGAAVVLLACVSAHAQELVRKPYIQSTSPTRSMVVWRFDSAVDAVVRYGASPDALDNEVAAPAGQHPTEAGQHEVAITGLSPKTRYYYSVSAGGEVVAGGDDQHYFVTAPETGAVDKFRVWIVGDSGTGGARQAEVASAMKQWTGKVGPDLYLHLGDMAYGEGSTSEFTNNFYNMYDEVLRNTVVWPTMGNHEGKNSDPVAGIGPYFSGYALPTGGEAGGVASGSEAYYSFDWGNVHFIVLESHQGDRSVDGPMLTWMQQDLLANDSDWLIAYWHHPPYTKGSHDSDGEGALIEMRENALPLLEAAGVDLVFGGHSHTYERSWLLDGAYDTPTVDMASIVDNGDGRLEGTGPYIKTAGLTANEGAVYVVAGHGGTGVRQQDTHPLMFVSQPENGSVILDVEDDHISVTNLLYNVAVGDTFTLFKGTKKLFVNAPNGGEQLRAGEKTEIRWTEVGATSSKVGIAYSADLGKTWQPVADDEANDGLYEWTVPEEATDAGMVRVTSADDATLIDKSNGSFNISVPRPDAIIKFGDNWKYHAGGVDHGNDWLQITFDDSDWPRGQAPIGYGDGDEATEVTVPDPPHTSVYFRKILDLPTQPTGGQFRIVHDDGLILWVNGQRLFERYVEHGVAYEAAATSASKDNELAIIDVTDTPYPFYDGENVIAVMIKQYPDDADDLSFDLELALDVPDVVTPTPDAEPSGCACTVPAKRGDDPTWLAIGLLGAVIVGRRFTRLTCA